ncbi:MAG: hypothetical protein AB7E81_18100 [Hyphomicrobiaceae bacterium]
MGLALPDWPALAIFCGLVLSVTLYALTLSVHFPAEHRRASLRGGAGNAVLWGTSGIAIVAVVMALRLGVSVLPGHVSVLAGGATILVAPLLLKPLPDSLIDDRAGLVIFAALAAMLALGSLNY